MLFLQLYPFTCSLFAYYVAVAQLFMNNYFYKSYTLFRMFVMPVFAPIHLHYYRNYGRI